MVATSSSRRRANVDLMHLLHSFIGSDITGGTLAVSGVSGGAPHLSQWFPRSFKRPPKCCGALSDVTARCALVLCGYAYVLRTLGTATMA